MRERERERARESEWEKENDFYFFFKEQGGEKRWKGMWDRERGERENKKIEKERSKSREKSEKGRNIANEEWRERVQRDREERKQQHVLCIKWNALHICFLQKQNHTRTHTHAHKCSWIFDIRYLICVAWLILLGMVIWICKNRFNTQIQIVLFKHHISNFGASRFLHSHKQCILFIQAWTHITQKLYHMIWDKTLFHKMYNNLLFIDDFEKKKKIVDSHCTFRFSNSRTLSPNFISFLREISVMCYKVMMNGCHCKVKSPLEQAFI